MQLPNELKISSLDIFQKEQKKLLVLNGNFSKAYVLNNDILNLALLICEIQKEVNAKIVELEGLIKAREALIENIEQIRERIEKMIKNNE